MFPFVEMKVVYHVYLGKAVGLRIGQMLNNSFGNRVYHLDSLTQFPANLKPETGTKLKV